MARLRGVTAAGILVIGALVTSACGSDSDASNGSGGAASSTTQPPAPEATTAEAEEAPETEQTLPSGGDGVTIVPADAFEGGLTLEDEGLSLTDDDSGRQLFTFKSLGDNLYQVKGIDSSGENDPLCWRAPDADEISPSPIVSGACDASSSNQQFKIVKSGEGYVISREGSGNLTVGPDGLEYDESDATQFRINF
jgi:hypothetical protein